MYAKFVPADVKYSKRRDRSLLNHVTKDSEPAFSEVLMRNDQALKVILSQFKCLQQWFDRSHSLLTVDERKMGQWE